MGLSWSTHGESGEPLASLLAFSSSGSCLKLFCRACDTSREWASPNWDGVKGPLCCKTFFIILFPPPVDYSGNPSPNHREMMFKTHGFPWFSMVFAWFCMVFSYISQYVPKSMVFHGFGIIFDMFDIIFNLFPDDFYQKKGPRAGSPTAAAFLFGTTTRVYQCCVLYHVTVVTAHPMVVNLYRSWVMKGPSSEAGGP